MAGNTVYAGGTFSSVARVVRSNLVAFDGLFGQVRSWHPDPPSGSLLPTVRTLTVADETLYVGGAFAALVGRPRASVGAFDVRTGGLRTWAPDWWGDYVDGLAALGSRVYVGARLLWPSRAYDAQTGQTVAWSPTVGGAHDNEGGFLLICSPGRRKPEENWGDTGTIARYNISRHDRARSFNISAVERTRVHHNAIYIGSGQDVQVVLLSDWTGWAKDLEVHDNLFHAEGIATRSKFRHRDHRFEWTRAEFQDWANGVADRFGYRRRFLSVGPEDAAVGAPTRMGVFERRAGA